MIYTSFLHFWRRKTRLTGKGPLNTCFLPEIQLNLTYTIVFVQVIGELLIWGMYVWSAGSGFLPGPRRRHHYGQQVWSEIPLRVPTKG
jgi:hypothetical protein